MYATTDLISNFATEYRLRMVNETESEIETMRVSVRRPLAL